jgi:MFS family permease
LTSALQRPLDRRVVITALGIGQILAWGTSFYFPAVFAEPIVAETGWSLGYVVAGTSLGLLVAGLISPQVGRIIDKRGGRFCSRASALLCGGLAGIGAAPALPVYLALGADRPRSAGTGLTTLFSPRSGRTYRQRGANADHQSHAVLAVCSTVCWPLSAS